MKVALTIETSVGVSSEKSSLMVRMSTKLSEYFFDKDYGNDLITILIGVICVAPEFEWFSKIRKPKYVFYRKYIRNSSEIIEDRVFSFDLKLDYKSFRNGSDIECQKMLANEIIKSLSNLDKLPKRVKDFRKEHFNSEMKLFFLNQKLLDEF